MLTIEEQKAKLDEIVRSLVVEVKPAVEKIEARLATTQNHYGDYLELLTTVSGGDKKMGQVVALALIKAGANREGVLSALQLAF